MTCDFALLQPRVTALDLVHVRLFALEQHDRERAARTATVCRFRLGFVQLARQALLFLFEIDHEHIGRLCLVRAPELLADERGYLGGQVYEAELTARIRLQFFGKTAVRRECPALIVDAGKRLADMLCHEAFRHLPRRVHLFFSEHVHTGREVQHVQDGMVNLHGAPFHAARTDKKPPHLPIRRLSMIPVLAQWHTARRRFYLRYSAR